MYEREREREREREGCEEGEAGKRVASIYSSGTGTPNHMIDIGGYVEGKARLLVVSSS
jgi:hypothetical protein